MIVLSETVQIPGEITVYKSINKPNKYSYINITVNSEFKKETTTLATTAAKKENMNITYPY